jgi:hypothetical protein
MENSTPNQNGTRRISSYLLIVFVASSIFYAPVIRSGSLEAGGAINVLPQMRALALAALVATFVFQRNLQGPGWRLGKPINYAGHLPAALKPAGGFRGTSHPDLVYRFAPMPGAGADHRFDRHFVLDRQVSKPAQIILCALEQDALADWTDL